MTPRPWPAEGRNSWLSLREKIPLVTGEIPEHSNLSVWLRSRLGHELNARRLQPLVCLLEIIDTKKQANPPGELGSDGVLLMVTVRLGEEQTGAPTLWPDDDPSLCSAVIGEGRLVLDQVEVQDVDEERDRLVVVSDDECNEIEMAHLVIIPCPAGPWRGGYLGQVDARLWGWSTLTGLT